MSASGKFIRWPWLASIRSRENVVATGLSDTLTRATVEDRSLSLAMLAEQCGEGVVICDPQQQIVFANPSFEHTTGFGSHELIGEELSLLYHDTQIVQWCEMSITGSWRGRVLVRSKDGGTAEQWLAVAPSRNAEGTIIHFVCVFTGNADAERADARLLQFMNLE
jgi:two-component system CheB/CheR fusion protein